MADPKNIVVYTSITGGKDSLKDNQVTAGIKFIAFLDQRVESSTWEVLPAINQFRDPRRNASMHKILAHQLFPTVKYTVWIDGTITIIRNLLPLLDKLMSACDVATFRHPERTCLYAEAEACKKFRLDDARIIDHQIGGYRSKRVPENLGLFETNVLIRKNNQRVRDFNNLWWSEICCHSRRDQLSMPVAARESGIRLAIIPGNAQNLPHVNPKRCGSDFFVWNPHLTVK